MDDQTPGPFRGHPPVGMSPSSHVSTAWVAANKVSSDTSKVWSVAFTLAALILPSR